MESHEVGEEYSGKTLNRRNTISYHCILLLQARVVAAVYSDSVRDQQGQVKESGSLFGRPFCNHTLINYKVSQITLDDKIDQKATCILIKPTPLSTHTTTSLGHSWCHSLSDNATVTASLEVFMYSNRPHN